MPRARGRARAPFGKRARQAEAHGQESPHVGAGPAWNPTLAFALDGLRSSTVDGNEESNILGAPCPSIHESHEVQGFSGVWERNRLALPQGSRTRVCPGDDAVYSCVTGKDSALPTSQSSQARNFWAYQVMHFLVRGGRVWNIFRRHIYNSQTSFD